MNNIARNVFFFVLISGLCLAFSGCYDKTPIPTFARVKNGQFVINNQAHYFKGFNYWYGGLLALTPEGKERLIQELDFLKAHDITNLRVMAAAEGTGIITGKIRVEPAFQPEAGVFNDSLLYGLDFLLYEMAKRDMKAVLYLSNNWEWSGGFLQYLNWGGVLPDSILVRKLTWDENRDWSMQFYGCTPCVELYREQVKKIVGRTNSITGKLYKEDPAIFAWQLANEPRPMRESAIEDYILWTKNISETIKSLDTNHLVSTGCEGYMGVENIDVFNAIHALTTIDYTTIHIWPKNWGWFTDTAIHASMDSIITKSNAYIRLHAEASSRLKKPMVIEEFGLPRDLQSFKPGTSVALRNRYFSSVFNLWQESVDKNEAFAGFNIWAFGGMGRPAGITPFFRQGDDLLGDPPQEEQGLNSVFNTDTSTWRLLEMYTTSSSKK
ncbi:MAG: beta-galactosidase [Chitinophagaceae bacterium]|nr:beta-galactosidase [Chitinophagaceae bacterium]